MSGAQWEMARIMSVVASAQNWVADATSLANDWTAPVDNALIDAVDTYQHPIAAGAGRMCLRDAAEEQRSLMSGQYVCTRVPGHVGGCRFRPVVEVASRL